MTHRPYPSPTRARHQLDRHAAEDHPRAAASSVLPSAAVAVHRWGAAFKGAQPSARQLVESWAGAFRPRPVGGEETT